MELILQVLMLFVVINTSLKLSFWRWWQAAIFSAVCGAFVIVAQQWAVMQSKTQLADYLANSTIMQDVAVLITIESVLILGYCLTSLVSSEKKHNKWWYRVLRWYPGVMIFPVLFYVLTQAIYAMPGNDFKTTSYLVAAGATLLIPLLGGGIKLLYPDKEARLELHLIVTAFVCVIGLITTVNGNVTYAAAEEPINLKAIIFAVALFGILFSVGLLWNRIKWRIISKRN